MKLLGGNWVLCSMALVWSSVCAAGPEAVEQIAWANLQNTTREIAHWVETHPGKAKEAATVFKGSVFENTIAYMIPHYGPLVFTLYSADPALGLLGANPLYGVSRSSTDGKTALFQGMIPSAHAWEGLGGALRVLAEGVQNGVEEHIDRYHTWRGDYGIPARPDYGDESTGSLIYETGSPGRSAQKAQRPMPLQDLKARLKDGLDRFACLPSGQAEGVRDEMRIQVGRDGKARSCDKAGENCRPLSPSSRTMTPENARYVVDLFVKFDKDFALLRETGRKYEGQSRLFKLPKKGKDTAKFDHDLKEAVQKLSPAERGLMNESCSLLQERFRSIRGVLDFLPREKTKDLLAFAQGFAGAKSDLCSLAPSNDEIIAFGNAVRREALILKRGADGVLLDQAVPLLKQYAATCPKVVPKNTEVPAHAISEEKAKPLSAEPAASVPEDGKGTQAGEAGQGR